MSKLTDEQITGIWIEYEGRELSWRRLLARAIESAATEPLLQRIAELERKSDQDDETILWQAKEISEKTDKLAELERLLEEALKDAEPVRRMKQRADELIAAFKNAPDGKALDMKKGQS